MIKGHQSCSSPLSPTAPTSSQTSRSTTSSQASESSDAPTIRCVSQAGERSPSPTTGAESSTATQPRGRLSKTFTARFRNKASTFGHYVTITLTVTVTDENGDMQEHDICAFDHYGNATTVNVDETTNNS